MAQATQVITSLALSGRLIEPPFLSRGTGGHFEVIASCDGRTWACVPASKAAPCCTASRTLIPGMAEPGWNTVHPTSFNRELVAAADIRTNEESDWQRNRSCQPGFAFKADNQRGVRLMHEHYRGRSPDGQFFRDHSRYTGVGLYLDF